jgi:RNA polymerase sigma-70 factor (ECF subfamily)
MKAGTVPPREEREVSVADPHDGVLLRRFVESGDRPAMGALFGRHADAAYRTALRICRNSADAEDAVQAAFFEVLRHAAKYRGESAVKAWVLGFVVNACRHKAREEVRRDLREERAARSEAAPAEERELRQEVRSAVQGLPEHYRVPVWLHYCEGLTSREVAQALGASENTIRSQLSRGVEQLRASLATAGLAVSVPALGAALAAGAVETAPPTLTASLASLATNALPAAAKAGVLARLAAGAVGTAAVVGTAAFLWFGNPDPPLPPMPPEFVRIERKVDEWQPTREERRFDEIGWAKDLPEALRLARESRRPVFVLAHVGRLATGRADGGSMSLREGPLSDDRVIQLINSRYVPVYAWSENPADREVQRIYREALAAKMAAGSESLYLLEPSAGRVMETMHICDTTTEKLLLALQKYAAALPGEPVAQPAPQSQAPPAPPDALVLHLTSRYLDKQGNPRHGSGGYHGFPAEDWIVLERSEWMGFLPPGPQAAAWDLDPATAGRILSHFYPLTGNFRDAATNVLLERSIRATVVLRHPRRMWVRLEGRLKMKHPFYLKDDPNVAEAAVVGFAEIDPAARRVRSLRAVAEQGTYGTRDESFGVALRSAP